MRAWHAAAAGLALAGCATTAPRPPVAENHATVPPPAAQKLGAIFIAEYGTCAQPHHMTLTVDGVVRAAVDTQCKPPPKPSASGIVIVDSDDSPELEAPPFEVVPGHHVFEVHDSVTGLSDRFEGMAPLRDPGWDPAKHHGQLGLLVDVVLVIIHDDWLRAGPGIRANIIRM